MKTKNDLFIDLNNNTKLGLEFIDKKEFENLSNKIYPDEILFGLVVGEILNEPWIVSLTNERLILVKKSNLYGSTIKEIGLENIADLKFESFGNSAALVIENFDNDFIKVESIPFNKVKVFGKAIANNIYSWNNNAISNLI